MVAGSMSGGYLRVGLLVLYVHDVSDITVDLLKMINYLKLENRAGWFLSEAIFVINLVCWVYWRLWIFPSKVMPTCMFESEYYWPGKIEMYWVCIPLLVALLVLHIWWTFLFFRIAYKLLWMDAHAAGQEEYEKEMIIDDKNGTTNGTDNSITNKKKQKKSKKAD
jgi:ceramide synthetase